MIRFLLPFFLIGAIGGYLLFALWFQPPPQDLGVTPKSRWPEGKSASTAALPSKKQATSSAETEQTTVTLTLRFHPFDNHVELLKTEFSQNPPPTPSPEPWNKEGVFVLRVQTTVNGKLFETWASVPAVEQWWKTETEPEHDVAVVLPYTKGMTILVNEPSGGRSYLQFVL